MKKSLFVFAGLLALGLVSCNETQQYPDSVLNSKWGQEAAIASYEALGVAVPYIENKGFEYEKGVDVYGDATITFYAFYDTEAEAEKAFNDYVDVCAYYGYSGEITTKTYVDYETYTYYKYESCIVDRVILDHHGIELEFLVSVYKEKPCLGIFGMTYLYVDPSEYPALALEEIYGKDASIFPVINEEGAKFNFQFFIDSSTKTEALILSVSNVSYEIEEWYFNQLVTLSDTSIFLMNDYDETICEAVTEYPGFSADGNYYYCWIKSYTVIFYFDIYDMVFSIEFYTVQ